MTSVLRRSPQSESDESGFAVTDTIVGELGDITDPEFFHDPSDESSKKGSYEMVYISGRDKDKEFKPWKFYVVRINPESGLPEGEGQLVGDDHFNFLKACLQGPEWGYDEDEGRSLFYTAVDEKGISQVARRAYSREENGWLPSVILTSQPHEGNILMATASTFKKSSIQVLYGIWIKEGENRWWWLDTSDPETVHHIENEILFRIQPPHWVEPRDGSDRCDLIYGATDNSSGLEQLYRYNTDDGTRHLLTTDEGNKRDPLSFFAPEYDGARIYAVPVVREGRGDKEDPPPTTIAIYKQVHPDYPFDVLERIGTLEIPEQARLKGYNFLSCIDPIRTTTRSYLAVRVAKDDSLLPDNNDSVFWVMSLDGQFQRQVSEHGNLGGMDQEIMIGTNEVFLYYNVYHLATKTARMHMCRTGITPNGDILP